MARRRRESLTKELDSLIEWRCPECETVVGKDDEYCPQCKARFKPVGASAEEVEKVQEHEKAVAEARRTTRREDKVAKTTKKRGAPKKAATEKAAPKKRGAPKTAPSKGGRPSAGKGKDYRPTAGSRAEVIVNALRAKGGATIDELADRVVTFEGGSLDQAKARTKVNQQLSRLRKDHDLDVSEIKSGPNKGRLRIR